MNKLNNTVIKVLSEKHGRKVIQWWKDQGVDTYYFEGTCVGNYYGVINSEFRDATSANGLKVIELPEKPTEMAQPSESKSEKTFPREMWVWDDDITGAIKKNVLFVINYDHKYVTYTNKHIIRANKNACELDEIEEISVEEAAKRLTELTGKLVKIKT